MKLQHADAEPYPGSADRSDIEQRCNWRKAAPDLGWAGGLTDGAGHSLSACHDCATMSELPAWCSAALCRLGREHPWPVCVQMGGQAPGA